MGKTINNRLMLLLMLLPVAVAAKPVDLQMGARAFGMGGAFTAIASDATAAYWNPAGLALLNSITISETNWMLADVENVNVNYFNAVFPLSGIGTIAGGWLLQHATLEEGHGSTYNETNWGEHTWSLAAGRQLWKKLLIFEKTSVGFSLNRHVIKAGDNNGAGVGFDLGALTYFPYGISLGFTAKSVATDMMGDRIAPEYRVGMGYTFSHPMHRVIVAADLLFKQGIEYEADVIPVDDFLGGNHKGFFGIEYSFLNEDWLASIRGGANQVVKSTRENTVYTGGVGGGFAGIYLHYAYQGNTAEETSIGNTHRVTVELQLDKLLKLVNQK